MRKQPHHLSVPTMLYKIVSDEQWQSSQGQPYLALGEIDTDFIHLATEQQVANVLKKFWPNASAWVLTIQTQALQGTLVHEKNPGGNTLYYHLYQGRIPMHAIRHAAWHTQKSTH